MIGAHYPARSLTENSLLFSYIFQYITSDYCYQLPSKSTIFSDYITVVFLLLLLPHVYLGYDVFGAICLNLIAR